MSRKTDRAMNNVQIGDTLICHETGKSFVAEQQGCTVNYATDNDGHVFSDEGVDIAERRILLDRTKPAFGYLSSDGKRFTGWKGNTLGTVTSSHRVKLTRLSYTHGEWLLAVRVRDVHGAMWYGRGSPSIAISLRAMKS